MSNRKIDHVPELSGISSYHGWAKAMALVLQSAQLWCYVSDGVNVLDPINLAWTRPVVTFSSEEDDFATLLKWQAGDAEVHELLLRRMTSTVKAVLPSKLIPQSVPIRLGSSESSASNLGLNQTLSWADPAPDTERVWMGLMSMSAPIPLRVIILSAWVWRSWMRNVSSSRWRVFL
jgi:hypothetical protein